MPDFVRLSTAIIALSSGKEAKKKYERLKHKGNSVFSAETAVKILFSCFFFCTLLLETQSDVELMAAQSDLGT